jgi:CheY-like chemotaxis protein
MPARKRIALIDDEADFCFFAQRVLEKTGRFRVSVAHDGGAGLRMLRAEKPDLILLDVMMPHMSGPNVADAVAADAQLKDIPLVFMTALVTDYEIGSRMMKEIAGRDYIAKPVAAEILIAHIDRILTL